MTMRWWSSSAVASPSYPHPLPGRVGYPVPGIPPGTRLPGCLGWVPVGRLPVGPRSLTRRQGGDLADRLDMPTGTGRRAVA